MFRRLKHRTVLNYIQYSDKNQADICHKTLSFSPGFWETNTSDKTQVNVRDVTTQTGDQEGCLVAKFKRNVQYCSLVACVWVLHSLITTVISPLIEILSLCWLGIILTSSFGINFVDDNNKLKSYQLYEIGFIFKQQLTWKLINSTRKDIV